MCFVSEFKFVRSEWSEFQLNLILSYVLNLLLVAVILIALCYYSENQMESCMQEILKFYVTKNLSCRKNEEVRGRPLIVSIREKFDRTEKFDRILLREERTEQMT